MTETQVAVIIERLDNVMDRLDDLDTVRLASIEKQTKETNGRVTSLERWKSYVLGGLAMAIFIIGVVVPFSLFILNRLF